MGKPMDVEVDAKGSRGGPQLFNKRYGRGFVRAFESKEREARLGE